LPNLSYKNQDNPLILKILMPKAQTKAL